LLFVVVVVVVVVFLVVGCRGCRGCCGCCGGGGGGGGDGLIKQVSPTSLVQPMAQVGFTSIILHLLGMLASLQVFFGQFALAQQLVSCPQHCNDSDTVAELLPAWLGGGKRPTGSWEAKLKLDGLASATPLSRL